MEASTVESIRIAMWSGPRNISTALMRSWGARGDAFVCDEPLYAHYLSASRTEHPAREEIIDAYETDWKKVVAWLTGPVPEGKAVFYQKHMAHHVLSGMMGEWITRLSNGFLIRDPKEMLISLSKVMEKPTLADTGLPQQMMLYDYVAARQNTVPPVIDARDVLEDPPAMLRRLCDAFDVPFSEAMLSWEPGLRESDGIWARHWYDSVRTSTGFRPYKPPTEDLPDRLRALYHECLPYYENLYRHRLTPQHASNV